MITEEEEEQWDYDYYIDLNFSQARSYALITKLYKELQQLYKTITIIQEIRQETAEDLFNENCTETKKSLIEKGLFYYCLVTYVKLFDPSNEEQGRIQLDKHAYLEGLQEEFKFLHDRLLNIREKELAPKQASNFADEKARVFLKMLPQQAALITRYGSAGEKPNTLSMGELHMFADLVVHILAKINNQRLNMLEKVKAVVAADIEGLIREAKKNKKL
ncbi:MAG: hypothetical protein ACO1O1_02355 [Adhaeribacter sp.]